jgi:hypothetical protein
VPVTRIRDLPRLIILGTNLHFWLVVAFVCRPARPEPKSNTNLLAETMPVYSTLQIDVGERFQQTMPLPLRAHISETLYRGFAAEMDDICESIQRKKDLANVIMTFGFVGAILGFALFAIGIPVGFVIFIGSPLLGMCCASCVRSSSSIDEIQQVCEDYSRRFGTVTVHYRVDVFHSDRDSYRYQTNSKEYLEFHYPNDKC